ncbi:exonuclease-like protein [Mycobacterium phage Weirdo19]|uniref:Exonuclease-like protein n=1 Tax=Mycobacterium phage Weirdo19 TaxID=2601610 RepID=A0A6M2YSQ3_9CAUD|nr:RecE-like recombination exonuclease [Mycobacterium phage Weirdo19]QEA10818.1 exonuclease-like protein [Mycobacterium phage Weirdo19]
MRKPGGVKFYTPRDPEFIAPGTDAWRRVITPSKVAAILSEPGDPVSRYESPFRLWHRMKGLTPPEAPRDAFDLGHDVEHLAAARYRRDRPEWLLSPGEVQAHVDPDKFGFPAIATLDRRGVMGASRRVVEFKMARNLTDLETWGDDLKGDLPDDYDAQLVALMLFTGWTKVPAELLVVGPYLEHRIYTREFDPSFASWIITKCRRFWESLAGDTPPELDNSTATYQCLRELHPDIDRGVEAIIPTDEAVEFLNAKADLDAATDAFALQKNYLLKRMERAQYAVVEVPGGEPIRIAERRNAGANKKPSFWPAKGLTAADIPTT